MLFMREASTLEKGSSVHSAREATATLGCGGGPNSADSWHFCNLLSRLYKRSRHKRRREKFSSSSWPLFFSESSHFGLSRTNLLVLIPIPADSGLHFAINCFIYKNKNRDVKVDRNFLVDIFVRCYNLTDRTRVRTTANLVYE